MLHFGRRQLLLIILLMYMVVLALLKCLDLSKRDQRGSADNQQVAKDSSGKSTSIVILAEVYDKYLISALNQCHSVSLSRQYDEQKC